MSSLKTLKWIVGQLLFALLHVHGIAVVPNIGMSQK